MMGTLRAYLQNEVVSARTRRFKFWGTELDATDRIFEAAAAGMIILGTSRQTLRDLEKAPSQHQQKLMSPLPGMEIAANDHVFLGMVTLEGRNGTICANPLVLDIIDERLYAAIRSIGSDENDGKHLLYATRNGYDLFVTNDGRIIDRRCELEKHCVPIRILRPSEVAQQLRLAS